MDLREFFKEQIGDTFEMCINYLANDEIYPAACKHCKYKGRKETMDCIEYRLADRCVELVNSVLEKETFQEGDYVEGWETVGNTIRVRRQVKGWVGSVHKDLGYIYIQADDGWEGARGTNIEYCTAQKLTKQKPKPARPVI